MSVCRVRPAHVRRAATPPKSSPFDPHVVGMVADGMKDEEILRDHPALGPDDIREALRYASEAVRARELPLRRAE